MAGYATPAWTNGSSPALNAANLLALGQAAELAQHPYGVCSTAAATAAKTVTVDFSGTLSLFTGLIVRVKFSNSNSAVSPTLNVSGTGAKAIKSYGTTAASTWIAGQVIEFVYDGTNWLMAGFDSYTKGQQLSASAVSAVADATGTTPTTPSDALSALSRAISGKVQVEVKSYTGNGRSGQNYPCSVTFSFEPKLVLFFGTATEMQGPSFNSGSGPMTVFPAVLLWGVTETFFQFYNAVGSQNFITYSGNTIQWYSNGTYITQFNSSGITYYLAAIG